MSITILGALAVLCAALNGFAVDEPPRKGQPADGDPKMSLFLDCAKACDACARTCDLCAAHCLKVVAAGNKEHVETARTCADCAAICQAASRVVAKNGPFSDLILTPCADACKRCGDACEKHAAHDPIMKQCADECRRCEKVCRQMLKTTPKPEK